MGVEGESFTPASFAPVLEDIARVNRHAYEVIRGRLAATGGDTFADMHLKQYQDQQNRRLVEGVFSILPISGPDVYNKVHAPDVVTANLVRGTVVWRNVARPKIHRVAENDSTHFIASIIIGATASSRHRKAVDALLQPLPMPPLPERPEDNHDPLYYAHRPQPDPQVYAGTFALRNFEALQRAVGSETLAYSSDELRVLFDRSDNDFAIGSKSPRSVQLASAELLKKSRVRPVPRGNLNRYGTVLTRREAVSVRELDTIPYLDNWVMARYSVYQRLFHVAQLYDVSSEMHSLLEGYDQA